MIKIRHACIGLLASLLAFSSHAQTSGVGGGSASGLGAMGNLPSAPPTGGNSKAGPSSSTTPPAYCRDAARSNQPECAPLTARAQGSAQPNPGPAPTPAPMPGSR